MSHSPEWPLVKVSWLDSSSPDNVWSKLRAWRGVGSLECISVGYLIAEDDLSKTIAPHLAHPYSDDCQGSGIIVIPSGAITSVERLTSSSLVAEAVSDSTLDCPESRRPSA
jgi:hypothetical protein